MRSSEKQDPIGSFIERSDHFIAIFIDYSCFNKRLKRI
jgi:hypothetical protein